MRKGLLILGLLLSHWASAFHIVGGELTYEYLGNDLYEVTMTIYRDCFSQGAPLDAAASVGIFDGNGELLEIRYFDDPFITLLENDVDFECDQISAQVCVERGVYQEVISLPPNDSGYYIAYQRCCRNSSILNLTTPDDWGATYQAFVPPQDLAVGNNSPAFNSFPPVGLCLDLPFVFDHGATDLDGDSLAYSFITPYHGGGSTLGLPPGDPDGPAPDPPLGPPWANIQWAGGYDVEYQIDADPGFALDPETGQLTGTPSQQGQYVIGIAVREYRNGQLLSEIRRDFQFNIVTCPTIQQASFSDIADGVYCNVLDVQFVNQSSNATVYAWDFGDGNISNEENPEHVYDEPGIYEVTLVTDPGDVCSDTSFATISIAEDPEVQILDPVLLCPEETYLVELSGDLDNLAIIDWQPGFLMETGPTDGPILEDVIFTTVGPHSFSVLVTDEIGCGFIDTYQFEQPNFPEASMEPITDSCQGLAVQFQSTSAYAQELSWVFDDPGNPGTSALVNPIHEFSEGGIYEVILTATAPNTCPDVVSQEVPAFIEPFLDLSTPDPQCILGNSFFFDAGTGFTPTTQFEWSFESAEIASSILQTPGAVSFLEPGTHEVTLIATDGPCMNQQSVFPLVTDELEVAFLTEGTGCAPYEARFLDLSVGGAGLNYSWDFGDGQTSDAPGTVTHLYESPGIYPVSVTVESTLGCLASETFSFGEPIQVFSSPQAGFFMDPPFADINDPALTVTSDAFLADECVFIITGQPTIESCDFTVEFEDGGEYLITQVVYTESGCEDRLTKPFVVNGHVFYAPNAITMNSDGVNDFFKPVVRGNIVEYELKIFDRWGGVLFQTQDINEPWVPQYGELGMHSFRARVRDSFNTGEIYTGTFVVIR